MPPCEETSAIRTCNGNPTWAALATHRSTWSWSMSTPTKFAPGQPRAASNRSPPEPHIGSSTISFALMFSVRAIAQASGGLI
eukprot:CAMPEP_0180399872 /NCGR_PEP_ID=MMETSP0989-20121125/37403_1 /TAXON_ID=697907 /ORGANISM="non described non described, Strain CCMP2293" /LENGTH=81 /DNA_ID=CAMNT_0022402629 /DNA_START=191 /DNA_END=433 /DNA_ORIENTATION=+